jgi:hypothetical protein
MDDGSVRFAKEVWGWVCFAKSGFGVWGGFRSARAPTGLGFVLKKRALERKWFLIWIMFGAVIFKRALVLPEYVRLEGFEWAWN